jgi:hypothetical protein
MFCPGEDGPESGEGSDNSDKRNNCLGGHVRLLA